MSLSTNRSARGVAIVTMVASVSYPAVVYSGLDRVPPLALVGLALALIGARVLTLRPEESRLWRGPLAAATVGLVALALVDGRLAALAYPVLLSLGLAVLFGRSLLFPPSVVERFARLADPGFPPEGVSYCRTVTVVWTLFLSLNGAIAAGLAVWGTPAWWTLWTGLVAYLLMGALFAGEYAVRQVVLRRRWSP